MRLVRPHACLLLGLLLAPAAAQGTLSATAIDRSLTAWQARHGQNWEIVHNEISGKARMLLGGEAFLYAPTSEAEEFQLARDFLEEAHDLFGVETSSLAEDRVLTLPLAALGTTDKRTVRFDQVIDGIPIEDHSVNVLLEPGTGRLLSIDSTATPGLTGAGRSRKARQALVTAADARVLAVQVFEMATLGPVEEIAEPRLVHIATMPAPDEAFTLVWAVDVAGQDESGADKAFRYHLDATSGTLVRTDDRLHDSHPQQIGGARRRVSAVVLEEGVCCLPGNCCWLPDNGENRVRVDLPYLTAVFGSGHIAVTDENGVFARPEGASADVTLRFKGPYVNIEDRFAAQDTVVTTRLRNGQDLIGAIQMNPFPGEVTVAQANAFYRLNQVRPWVRGVNPDDATADSASETESLPFRAVVNSISPSPPFGCGATYNGQGIRFFASTPQCANSAFAAVLFHEMGHWFNDLYHNGNGATVQFRGFGEGVADVVSLYMLDYQRLFYENVNLRDGTNTMPSCGDCEGYQHCYGEVHRDGLPLMGAFWKMRVNLKAMDAETGGPLADALFLGWLNAYDQHRIHSMIEFQLLVLDDDDADLSNGTPHAAAIDAAFRAHAFQGFDPEAFARGGHNLTVKVCR